MLSNVIIEGKDHTFQKTILIDGVGLDRMGKTCTVSIQRLLDAFYWDVSQNAWIEGVVENPVDTTIGYGLLNLSISKTSNFFSTDLGVTEYDILVSFTVTDDGTSEVVYQDSEIMTISKGTPLAAVDIANGLSVAPTIEPVATSANRFIRVAHDLRRYAFEFDFSTYSKAVLLYYDEDRDGNGDFTGDPVYWSYIYNAAGGKPTNSSEIAKQDRVYRWIDGTPT